MNNAFKVGRLASACLLALASAIIAPMAIAQMQPAANNAAQPQQLQGNVAPPASAQQVPVQPQYQQAPAQQGAVPNSQGFPAQPYQGATQPQQAQQGNQQQVPIAPQPQGQQFPGQQQQTQQQPNQGMTVAAVPLQASPSQAPVAAPASLPPLPPVQHDVDQYSQTYFGVSPDQIRQMYQTVITAQQAVAQPGPAPKPVTGTVSVSLSPGSTPPVIRTYIGNSTSFVIVDSSGAPWPVENFRVGNGSAFELNRLDAGQGSSFVLDTKAPFANSNLVLKLMGVATPVVINLISGQKEVDARVEVRVQGRGPNAVSAVAASLPQGVDSRLLSILNGVSPDGGRVLAINGLEGVRAWMMPSGRMVVRTPVKIVSPASPSFVSSADGTYVYEFMPTTQLLGLVDGQFVTLQVGGW